MIIQTKIKTVMINSSIVVRAIFAIISLPITFWLMPANAKTPAWTLVEKTTSYGKWYVDVSSIQKSGKYVLAKDCYYDPRGLEDVPFKLYCKELGLTRKIDCSRGGFFIEDDWVGKDDHALHNVLNFICNYKQE